MFQVKLGHLVEQDWGHGVIGSYTSRTSGATPRRRIPACAGRGQDRCVINRHFNIEV